MVPMSSTEEISIRPFGYQPYLLCRCSASAAARSVPYDSPAKYLGDNQRPLRVVHSRITSPIDSMSRW